MYKDKWCPQFLMQYLQNIIYLGPGPSIFTFTLSLGPFIRSIMNSCPKFLFIQYLFSILTFLFLFWWFTTISRTSFTGGGQT